MLLLSDLSSHSGFTTSIIQLPALNTPTTFYLLEPECVPKANFTENKYSDIQVYIVCYFWGW